MHELQGDRALDEVDEDRIQVEQKEHTTVGVVGIEAVAAGGHAAGLGPFGGLVEPSAHIGVEPAGAAGASLATAPGPRVRVGAPGR